MSVDEVLEKAKEMAQGAITLAKPSIKAMQVDGIAKRKDGYLVIGSTSSGALEARGILAVEPFGEQTFWEHHYGRVAVDKYNISVEYGASTREVHELYPDKVDSLPTPYKGSAFNKEYGIIVAFSGVDEHIDEAIAELVLAIFVGLVRDAEKKAAQPVTTD